MVHADETGWCQDGANGYVWTFSTPTERYFLRRSRGKGVVDEVLPLTLELLDLPMFGCGYSFVKMIRWTL